MNNLQNLLKTLETSISTIESNGFKGFVFISYDNDKDPVGTLVSNYESADIETAVKILWDTLTNLRINLAKSNQDDQFSSVYKILMTAVQLHIMELNDKDSKLSKNLRYIEGNLNELSPEEIAYFKSADDKFEIKSSNS